MTRDAQLRLLLRSGAVLIALAAAFDPAITSLRTSHPLIAVVTVDAQRDSANAHRAATTLAHDYTVLESPFTGADATVIVGDHVPSGQAIGSPVVAVLPDTTKASLTIESTSAPESADLRSSVPIAVSIRGVAVKGTTADATLRQNGVTLDRAVVTWDSSQAHGSALLHFTPSKRGMAALEVVATIVKGSGSGTTASVNVATEIRDIRWPVLFYDARPSWLATFARRAIESDQRFDVTSRTLTSRNISTEVGKPPISLADAQSLNNFDAIVVGAPGALTDRDVTGLEAYIRRRGGSVVLLLDERGDGAYQRLLDAGKWDDNGSGKVVRIRFDRDSTSLKASEITWPSHLPRGAELLAASVLASNPADPTSQHPVIWQLPIGNGRVIVSGALDAWRYRDAGDSQFDQFWQMVVSRAAAATPTSIAVRFVPSVAAPNEDVTVEVAIAAANHALPSQAAVDAILERDGSPGTPLHLWPTGTAGTLRGTFRAPPIGGSYRVAVTSGDEHAEAALAVVSGAVHAEPANPLLLAAWATAHGGSAITIDQLSKLSPTITRVVHSLSRNERWHPMRSPWWLLPFVALLGGEWWLRRRGGKA